MPNQFNMPSTTSPRLQTGVRERSDRLINYFLGAYFLLGLVFAPFYGTWLIAIGVGGLSLVAYYSARLLLPGSCLYQYILSLVLGLFMAQFIYQMHGMFEMHFFAFIGSVMLITYQKWKLQLPMLVFVVFHHGVLSHLQNIGFSTVYFSQLNYFDLGTFTIHILLTVVIYFISGLCAFQLQEYHRILLHQMAQMNQLQAEANLSLERRKNEEAMIERNTILESIGDAFFAVDKNWIVTYWNQMAEKVLYKAKEEILNHNLWAVFYTAVDSESYRRYHEVVSTGLSAHFEDYFAPLDKWYDISAYPSGSGLSVYFKDITEHKKMLADLRESEKRYSDVFHFSPVPKWIVNLDSLEFMDVNEAATVHYGYSRAEFLTMTLKDIRPASELANMERALGLGKTETTAIRHRQMIHQKKNGELMHMDLQLAPFLFKGVRTSICVAIDITERLTYIKAIEAQNEKLIAISWMQSHVIRAPLVRIMGLIPLIKDLNIKQDEKIEMLDYLAISADELDAVIKNITDATNVVAVK